jgi:hypothetical protein
MAGSNANRYLGAHGSTFRVFCDCVESKICTAKKGMKTHFGIIPCYLELHTSYFLCQVSKSRLKNQQISKKNQLKGEKTLAFMFLLHGTEI